MEEYSVEKEDPQKGVDRVVNQTTQEIHDLIDLLRKDIKRLEEEKKTYEKKSRISRNKSKKTDDLKKITDELSSKNLELLNLLKKRIKFIIVPHSEAISDAAGSRSTPGENLTEKGIGQSKAKGKLLLNYGKIDYVYCSRLERAKQTLYYMSQGNELLGNPIFEDRFNSPVRIGEDRSVKIREDDSFQLVDTFIREIIKHGNEGVYMIVTHTVIIEYIITSIRTFGKNGEYTVAKIDEWDKEIIYEIDIEGAVELLPKDKLFDLSNVYSIIDGLRKLGNKEIDNILDGSSNIIVKEVLIKNYIRNNLDNRLFKHILHTKNDNIIKFVTNYLLILGKVEIVQKHLLYLVNGYIKKDKNFLEDIILSVDVHYMNLFLKTLFLRYKTRKQIQYLPVLDFIFEIFKKSNNTQYILLYNYYFNLYEFYLKTINRSFDYRVRKGNDINPHFDLGYNANHNNILSLLSTGDQFKYIEGSAGSGKSFLLAQLIRKLYESNFNIDGKYYFPLYFDLSGEDNIENIINRISIIENKFSLEESNYTKVMFFDALDESRLSFPEKKDLYKKLSNYTKRGYTIILTTRYNKSEEEEDFKDTINSDTEHVKLENVRKEEHIIDFGRKYFSSEDEKYFYFLNILKFKSLNGQAMPTNYLILSLICQTIEKAADINQLDILDLYETVSTKMLKEWNMGKIGRDLLKSGFYMEGIEKERNKLIQKDKEILCRFAYEATNFKYTEDDKSIEYYKIFFEDILKSLGYGINLERLNLLSDENFYFIDERFGNYYFAKYLFDSIIKKEEKFDYHKLITEVLTQGQPMGLFFFCEMVKRNKLIRENILNSLDKIGKSYNYKYKKIEYVRIFILASLDLDKLIDYINSLSSINHKIGRFLTIRKGKDDELINGIISWNKEDLLYTVISVLGLIGGKEHIALIKKLINNKNVMVACQVIKELGRIRGIENIEFIRSYLDHDYYEFRIAVINTFAENGVREYIEEIAAQIDTDNIILRNTAIRAIIKLCRKDNIELFTNTINNNPKEVLIIIKGISHHLSISENLDIIDSTINNSDIKISSRIIKNLVELAQINHYNDDILSIFKKNINNKNINIRFLAIKALIEVGREDERLFVENYLKREESITVLRDLISSLIKTGRQKCINFVCGLVNTNNFKLVRLLIYIIYRDGGEKRYFIHTLIDSENIHISECAIDIICNYQLKEDIEFLKTRIFHQNIYVRIKIIQTILKIGGEENIVLSIKAGGYENIRLMTVDRWDPLKNGEEGIELFLSNMKN